MNKPLVLIAGFSLCTGVALAQSVSETTTAVPVVTTAPVVTTTAPVVTTAPLQSAGSVTTFDPSSGAFVVTPENSAPVTYTYSPQTTIVDADGNPVGVDVVRSGAPVTVYYTRTGNQMIASKVVVRKTVTTQTIQTTR